MVDGSLGEAAQAMNLMYGYVCNFRGLQFRDAKQLESLRRIQFSVSLDRGIDVHVELVRLISDKSGH